MNRLELNLCECGCGQNCQNRFISGHNTRIYNYMKIIGHTDKSKRLMSEIKKQLYKQGYQNPFFGKKHTEKSKKEMSLSKIGVCSGENHYLYGKEQPEKVRKKISESKTGKKSPPFTEKHRENLSKSLKGREFTEEWKHNLSIAKINLQFHHSEKTKQNLSQKNSRSGNPFYKKKHTNETIIKISGPNSHSWKGGISKEPYCQDWVDELKEYIRNRDNYICQNCGILEKNLKRKLSIHHIDYNKKNCKPENLISLCVGCNSRANSNREYWINFYKRIISCIS